MARATTVSADLHSREDPQDLVVLLDEDAQPIGAASRLRVHRADTPLHLAFSTYIFNSHGEVLLTRRALDKLTWPGVWTNSCCGHPRPGEAMEDAARRRILEELGIRVATLLPLLPDFRYRAVDASGVVENEICPVFAAHVLDDTVDPDPDEVAECMWVPWVDVVASVRAVPGAYSPWAALQVPRIDDHFRRGHADTASVRDIQTVLTDVDALLTAEFAALADEWQSHVDLGVDVLAMDLPRWIAELGIGRGKRLRVQLAWWGYVAAGGQPSCESYDDVVRVAAALEVLHLFALVHDDVMDESDRRRGIPAAHVQATQWHRAANARGDAELFGRNLAILLGDLAHAVADRLVKDLPAGMRDAWYSLTVELIAGQRADLTGAAAGRLDLAHAESVARTKSGRYSVVRPLELGAMAAGATPSVTEALMRAGEHLGEAFALRDDLLGIWGDPERTGKPIGDDLVDAKATVVVSRAAERLEGSGAALLTRLGTPDFTRADATSLAGAMHDAGIDADVEALISDHVSQALAILDDTDLTQLGSTGLNNLAHRIAWRDS